MSLPGKRSNPTGSDYRQLVLILCKAIIGQSIQRDIYRTLAVPESIGEEPESGLSLSGQVIDNLPKTLTSVYLQAFENLSFYRTYWNIVMRIGPSRHSAPWRFSAGRKRGRDHPGISCRRGAWPRRARGRKATHPQAAWEISLAQAGDRVPQAPHAGDDGMVP